MLAAVSQATAITISVGGVIVLLALLALLRVLFRREPSPPTWKRLRAGVFLERDPARKAGWPGEHDDDEDTVVRRP